VRSHGRCQAEKQHIHPESRVSSFALVAC
jgi:hypothetical protein